MWMPIIAKTDTESETIIRIPTDSAQWPIRIRPTVPLDDDALLAISAANQPLRIEQCPDGELIFMPPSGSDVGRITFAIMVRFGAWVERDGSGIGFTTDTGFRLPNNAVRGPDTSWIRKERWEAITPELRKKFVPLAPDFVIEIRSPSDRLRDQKAKLEEYMACGVQLGWLIDPIKHTIWIYRPGKQPERQTNPERIVGEPPIDGFVLELHDLW